MSNYLKKVVTLKDNSKWYICDKTIQEDDIYYLGLKVDDNYEVSDESKIFKRVEKNGKVYLTSKIDDDTLKYLIAIFLNNFNNNADKIAKSVNR